MMHSSWIAKIPIQKYHPSILATSSKLCFQSTNQLPLSCNETTEQQLLAAPVNNRTATEADIRSNQKE